MKNKHKNGLVDILSETVFHLRGAYPSTSGRGQGEGESLPQFVEVGSNRLAPQPAGLPRIEQAALALR